MCSIPERKTIDTMIDKGAQVASDLDHTIIHGKAGIVNRFVLVGRGKDGVMGVSAVGGGRCCWECD